MIYIDYMHIGKCTYTHRANGYLGHLVTLQAGMIQCKVLQSIDGKNKICLIIHTYESYVKEYPRRKNPTTIQDNFEVRVHLNKSKCINLTVSVFFLELGEMYRFNMMN